MRLCWVEARWSGWRVRFDGVARTRARFTALAKALTVVSCRYYPTEFITQFLDTTVTGHDNAQIVSSSSLSTRSSSAHRLPEKSGAAG